MAIITWDIKKVNECEGIYLKWMSNHDGWLYWLFNEKRKETINTKSLGTIENDFEDADITISPKISLGKTADKTYKLHATGIEQYERDIIETIIESPKVYLYTGELGVATTPQDWLEVELVTNSYLAQNYNKVLFNLEIDIKIKRNTMIL